MLAKPRARRRPGAVMTTELLLTLPSLMLLLAGVLAVGQLLMARQALATASAEGARAGVIGGSATDVENAARRALAGSGALIHSDVQVTFFQASDGNGGAIPMVAVTVSAPVSLALIGAPQSPLSALGNGQIMAISVMRVY